MIRSMLALSLLLGGCSPDLIAERLVTVTLEPPPLVLPAECYREPGRFPAIPVAKDAAGVPGSVLLGTLNAGREAHRREVELRRTCRSALEHVAPSSPRSPPGS